MTPLILMLVLAQQQPLPSCVTVPIGVECVDVPPPEDAPLPEFVGYRLIAVDAIAVGLPINMLAPSVAECSFEPEGAKIRWRSDRQPLTVSSGTLLAAGGRNGLSKDWNACGPCDSSGRLRPMLKSMCGVARMS